MDKGKCYQRPMCLCSESSCALPHKPRTEISMY